MGWLINDTALHVDAMRAWEPHMEFWQQTKVGQQIEVSEAAAIWIRWLSTWGGNVWSYERMLDNVSYMTESWWSFSTSWLDHGTWHELRSDQQTHIKIMVRSLLLDTLVRYRVLEQGLPQATMIDSLQETMSKQRS